MQLFPLFPWKSMSEMQPMPSWLARGDEAGRKFTAHIKLYSIRSSYLAAIFATPISRSAVQWKTAVLGPLRRSFRRLVSPAKDFYWRRRRWRQRGPPQRN